MHLIWRLFAAYVRINTQEHLAYCFCLKIPKLEPQLRHHWAMSKHHKSKHYSLLFGETEATRCFYHPSSPSRGCLHGITAQNGGAPRHRVPTFLRWSPVSAPEPCIVQPNELCLSVLHCLRKESLGVLQLQSVAQVREAKDTAWNVLWIKQRRLGLQRVNITLTHGSAIHTAAPGKEFFLLPQKMFDGPRAELIGHYYFCFCYFCVKELVC